MVARRILVRGEDKTVELVEQAADSEVELQNVLRDAPNLVPIDDLGLDGPMMVIGRETALPSGRVDLLGVTPTGDLLIVEFKTGPANPDYRHALAQLLDYGADLWQMDPEEFDTTVTVSYLASKHCPADDPAHGAADLRDAAQRTWPHLEDADLDAFQERIAARLAEGRFHFVLAAQRITRNARSTIEYLQQTHGTASFHAVELVKFVDETKSTIAYEGRAVTSPSKHSGPRVRRPSSPGNGSPEAVLAAVDDVEYRKALEELLEYCTGLQLTFEPGAVGFSIRVSVPDRREPVSIGWLFPPDTSGFMGMTGLNLGYDNSTVDKLSVAHHFAAYLERLHQVPGSETVHAGALEAVRIPPTVLTSSRDEITEALGELVSAIGQSG